MSGRPIRVLHLRDSPWVDGPGRTIVETASHIDRTRVEYHVGALISTGSLDHPLLAALRSRGAVVHELHDQGGVDADLIEAIVRLLDKLQIDILHSSEFRSNVLALLVRRKRRVKLIATGHGWIANDMRGRVYRFADKVLMRGFDHVILVSGAMRRLVPRWWLPEARVSVVLNALVTSEYGADIVNRPRRIPDTSRGAILLNIGRLSPEKGQDLLVRAVASLAADYPALRLRFAGVGPMEPELRSLVAALGIAHLVEFLGFVKDMPQLYYDSDLVVQSSLTEGLPNVVLESAFLRAPLVATSVGGTAEVVEHGRSAWLIRPGSVEELISGIRRFLEQPADFVALGHAAHERILTQFGFPARTENLMRVYEFVRGVRG